MSKSDFHFEFHSDITQPVDALRDEVEQRLRELADGHTDFIGAAVTVEEVSQDRTPHTYRTRIVAYIRPEDIAAIEKDRTVEGSMHQTLQALERQIRKRRERLGKPWQQTEEVVHADTVDELTAEELYEAYAEGIRPDALLDMGRVVLASRLMTEEGFDQDAAYYAADQILAAAQDRLDAGQSYPPEVE